MSHIPIGKPGCAYKFDFETQHQEYKEGKMLTGEIK
jgi:hypothetical protein